MIKYRRVREGQVVGDKTINDLFDNDRYLQESINDLVASQGSTEGRVETIEVDLSENILRATEAVTIAEAAEAKAIIAQTQAETALTTANNAHLKAENAIGIANSANTKADTAIADAASAQSVAASAISKADTAITSALNAQTAANNAQSTATSASTKADTALSAANSASSVAATAQATADSANSKADTNASAISVIQGKVASVENAIVDHGARIAALEASSGGGGGGGAATLRDEGTYQWDGAGYNLVAGGSGGLLEEFAEDTGEGGAYIKLKTEAPNNLYRIQVTPGKSESGMGAAPYILFKEIQEFAVNFTDIMNMANNFVFEFDVQIWW